MKTKAVLFDMDGVLVDVSNSYRLAVKKTAEHFLNREISLDTIQQYKNRGGLNNDWDLTESILHDHGLKVDKEKIIRVFQQFYLGKNHDGLIQQEQWLLSRETLNWICKNFKTGIVTGRPGSEALFTLKRFKVRHFFQVIVAMEDVPPDRGKPDPLGIQLALEKLQVTDGWYIGDTIDDMATGKKAGLIPIGVVNSQDSVIGHQQEELLRKYGALQVTADVNKLKKIIKSFCRCFTDRGGFFKKSPWPPEARRKKMRRTADVKRKTKETEIVVSLDLDGTGSYRIDTPVGFFNHMLESFAKHGGFDLTLKAEGDIHVDQHHMIEDCGIVLGQAIEQASGEKRGIQRAGFFIFPMDEALALAAVDFGGRPYLQYDAQFSHQYCGSMEIGILEDFFQAMSVHARANIVVRILHGRSDHHKAEAAFKALAKAMRMACNKNPGNVSSIPSTKGVI